GNPGEAGAGSLARDHRGRPIFAFHDYIGDQTSTIAELLAVWRALSLCQDLTYDRVWIELDSERERDLIQKIRALTDNLDVSFSHIYCEGYSAADYLAGSACRARDFVLYDVADLPGPLRGIIRMDLEYPSIIRPHDDSRTQG
ncbi:ribonuclease H, partial [Striga asiatica]